MPETPEGTSIQDQAEGIPLGLLGMEDSDEQEVEEKDEDEDSQEETESESEEESEESEESDEKSEEPDETEESDYLLIGEEKVSYDDIGEVWAKKANLDKGFTQKMQSLSEDRKAFEAEQTSWKEGSAAERQGTIDRLEMLDNALAKIGGEEPDWQKIRAELPAEEYAAQVADWQVVKGNREKVQAEAEALKAEQAGEVQSQIAAYATSERGKLLELEPEFEKTEYVQGWMSYVKDQGFSDEDISQTLNHRIYLLVDKARKYDDLVAGEDGVKKVVAKKVKDAPVVKPGVRPAKGKRNRKASEEAVKRATRTGKLQDAADSLVGLDELLGM